MRAPCVQLTQKSTAVKQSNPCERAKKNGSSSMISSRILPHRIRHTSGAFWRRKRKRREGGIEQVTQARMCVSQRMSIKRVATCSKDWGPFLFSPGQTISIACGTRWTRILLRDVVKILRTSSMPMPRGGCHCHPRPQSSFVNKLARALIRARAPGYSLNFRCQIPGETWEVGVDAPRGQTGSRPTPAGPSPNLILSRVPIV